MKSELSMSYKIRKGTKAETERDVSAKRAILAADWMRAVRHLLPSQKSLLIPTFWGGPVMECVFPEPVCPNAKQVHAYLKNNNAVHYEKGQNYFVDLNTMLQRNNGE